VTTHTGTDGRRLRRERGRAAVTEAMIDLLFEGRVPPTTEQLAERAGVSVASVFRYFDGLDDLRRAATSLYLDRSAHLFEIPGVGVGSLSDRIERFVDARLRLYDAAEPMGRLVRMRAPEHPGANDTLNRLRVTYADQIDHHFDEELDALAPADRESVVAGVATLTSFESWDQCRLVHGFDANRIRATWINALTALIRASR
jgi:AcrR family transcriptional regulator